MLISVINPVLQTEIFSVLFLVLIFSTFKKILRPSLMSRQLTDQLKGVAILMIVFSHIGYFLSQDTRFLFPISVFAGVGVNLFLLMSGFGLTMSALGKNLGIWGFYKKRLSRLYTTVWLVLAILFLLDFILLNKSYPLTSVLQSFLGFFPQANLYTNIDSPLWFFTLILFYYLVFPVFSQKKIRYFSPFLIYLLSFLITEKITLPINPSVLNLYKVHLIAFPLGISLALINYKLIAGKFTSIINFGNGYLNFFLKVFFSLILLYFIGYTALYSGVGHGVGIEQTISTFTTICIILLFNIIDFELRIFNLFGKYSYEIYLFHWPLVYRYDLIYKIFPAYLATLIYLGVFIALGFLIQKVISYLTSSKTFLKSPG